ncbi:Signal transduction histidine kinase [Paenibacillus algorifonticola]|uniref:histidine kinase n=1 Tax=Paenibacillus algorifonticola TaxID=684063 RepID=A0A1I2F8G1_9BACL|nr:HAMP domain-containing sensor histidine kinase [Paenibacillus algorifonticola]SFF00840.1 Signal transduction histidine kinase [Paenibacillus algorifonticola]
MKWTIQYKMVALFSIIVFIGFSAMLIISYRMTEENMYRTIHEDMVDVKTKLDIAVNQYFLINRKRMSSNSLAVEKQALAKEIGSVVDGSVVIYKPDGQSFDYTEESRASSFNASPELAAAAKHEIAYVTYLDREQAIASLAFPLESNHTTIGILRYQRDYSELYQRNLRFQNTLEGFAVVLFIFIFAASVMISRKITRPIRELTQLSTKVSQGNLNVDIQIHAKDEIGELAGTFTAMINRIREQIDVIERERDEVTQIQARSKTFFDNVTHELKTPLTTILGYAQILKDNGFTDKVFFDKGLDYVIKESQRLNGMVVDILDMSVASTTNQTYRMKQVDLSGLVQEACEDMKVKASKYNIVIHYEVEDRMLLHGDREKLKQAFLNVMDNSIKYGHVNSIISVEAYRQHNLNIVIVRDKGNGVKEELLQRVFEPFYRGSGMAKEERGSAGLGLSIVKSTVEYHGGTIVMSSRINEGTEVTISFPGGEYEQV